MVRRLSGATRAAVPEGTDGWTWALPLVFQSLASPSTARFPQRPGGGPHEVEAGVLGYWAALQGFLTYVLGWRRHDRGLRWWIDQGRPTEDPHLAFLTEVWGAMARLSRICSGCSPCLMFATPALFPKATHGTMTILIWGGLYGRGNRSEPVLGPIVPRLGFTWKTATTLPMLVPSP
jgi:hypothetical protein